MSDTSGNGNGNGNGNGRRGLPQVGQSPVAALSPETGFPASTRVYLVADGVKVPVRRI